MRTLGLVISDGVGFRNFILSDFLNQAEKNFDQVIIYSFLPKGCYPENVQVFELEALEEKFFTWFFRKGKEIAHLKLHQKNNFGIQDNLRINNSKANNPRGFATRFLFKFTHLFHSEKWITKFNSLQIGTFKNKSITKKYKEILLAQKPDVLFFSHQRPPFIAPLIYVAQKLEIKTASFIFSWDNLASKGRMAGNFNHYLVWSQLMQQELLQFYTHVKSENIHVVGTPQFEPYVMKEYASTQESFFQKFSLNPNLQTICFSCGDISTSKNDELYIETIAQAIIDKKIPEVNFLVRTSPAEDPKRFDFLKDKFPSIKWNAPKWKLARENHQETWSQRIPTSEDVLDLRSILEFSTININMLSTMSLDFMLFDKPVINPVFGNDSNGLYNDQRFLKYQHIEHVVNSGASKIVKDESELIFAINKYLNNASLDSENRKKLVDLEIGMSLEGTSNRIVEALKSLT